MKIYKAKKKGFIIVILIASLIPAVIYYLSQQDTVIDIIISFVPLSIFLWIYLDTGYKIKGNKLYYRSAFLRGKIDIKKNRSDYYW